MSEVHDASKQPARRVVQLIVVLGFFGLIVYFFRKYSADLSAIRNLSVLDIANIGLWLFISYTAYAWSQYIVLRDLGLKSLGAWRWLQIYYVSRAMNFVIIQGANLYRMLILKHQYGFSLANSVGVTAYILWLNAIAALSIAALALPALLDSEMPPAYATIAVIVGLTALPIIVTLLIGRSLELPMWQNRFTEPVAKIVRFFNASYAKPLLNLRLFGFNVVNFIFFAGAIYFSFRALDADVPVLATLVFSAAFILTRYVSIVPGNIGLSELVSGLVAEMLGTGFGAGLLVAAVIRVVELLLIGTLGVANGGLVAYKTLAAQRKA